MQVLIIKTSSMGDILHTLPALTDAMQAIPNIQFGWVVEEEFSQIPTWHPAVNHVIPVSIRSWRKNWFSSITRQQRTDFRYKLQQRSYEVVIDAQALIKSAVFITRFARGNKHGQDHKSAREPFASWFYDHRHTINRQQHAVERTRQLFAKSLDYNQPKKVGDYAIVERFLSQVSTATEQYLVFLHATTRDDKHWTEKNWRELVMLVENSGIKIKLPWSAKHEYMRALRIADGFTHVEVLPKFSLQQIAELLASSKGVVSVDTGLSHLTAALNKTNITLFGPTNPILIGSYGQNQYHLLPIAGKKMANISPRQVYHLLQQQQIL